jgi:hypothetical protein
MAQAAVTLREVAGSMLAMGDAATARGMTGLTALYSVQIYVRTIY